MSAHRPERASEVEVSVQRAGAAGGAPGVAPAGAVSAASASARDRVAVEEPLEIRLGARSLLVTMRTPGRDLDLVRGLLWTEGLVAEPGDVTAVTHCSEVPPEAVGNVVLVALRPGAKIAEEHALRVGLVSSACGVCGKSALEAVAACTERVGPGPSLTQSLIAGLPAKMRDAQPLFDSTGGLHAAALFDARGQRLAQAEDVGRHNAVDKVIGEALRYAALPLADTILLVSGRAGFEIIHKARRAGIPVIASVSAPSSLAIQLATDGGQTLIGFLRDGRFNVYCGEQRLQGA